MNSIYAIYGNHFVFMANLQPLDSLGGSFSIARAIITSVITIIAAYIIFRFFLRKKIEEFKRSVDSILGPVPMLPELSESDGNYEFFRSFEVLSTDKINVRTERKTKNLEPFIMDEKILSSLTEKSQFLLVYQLDENEIIKEISSFPAWLGKDDNVDVVIEGDSNIDNRHGIIYIKDGVHYYSDANSINGSVVDGEIDIQVAQIKNGSTIQLASVELKVIINYESEN